VFVILTLCCLQTDAPTSPFPRAGESPAQPSGILPDSTAKEAKEDEESTSSGDDIASASDAENTVITEKRSEKWLAAAKAVAVATAAAEKARAAAPQATVEMVRAQNLLAAVEFEELRENNRAEESAVSDRTAAVSSSKGAEVGESALQGERAMETTELEKGRSLDAEHEARALQNMANRTTSMAKSGLLDRTGQDVSARKEAVPGGAGTQSGSEDAGSLGRAGTSLSEKGRAKRLDSERTGGEAQAALPAREISSVAEAAKGESDEAAKYSHAIVQGSVSLNWNSRFCVVVLLHVEECYTYSDCAVGRA